MDLNLDTFFQNCELSPHINRLQTVELNTDQVYLWSQAASLPRLQMLSGDDKIMQDWQKMHQANNPYL